MPQKVLISFSDEQITKLGNCKTAVEFQAAVDAAIGKESIEQKVILMEDVTKIFNANIATINASVEKVSADLKAVTADVAKVDPAKIVADATAAGSMAAAKALGKVGANGAGAADANPSAELNGDKSTTAQLIAAGKYEEAYAADEKIRVEFFDAKAYAGYMKASAKGQVKILSRQ